MKEVNTFQTALLIVFGVLVVAGFIAFAMFSPKSSDPANNIGDVVIWGTLEQQTMEQALAALDELLPRGYEGSITYAEYDERVFNAELVDALAAGAGPDIALVKHSDLIKQLNKIYAIPFESYPTRRFKDTYIEGTELFVGAEGILALPFVVDPLIMYWNRDILSREGVPVVPEYWDEFFTLSPKLTKHDNTANIYQATVPFGEYRNVVNAKEIVSALLLQAGNPITQLGDFKSLDVYLYDESDISDTANSTESALRFYTEFSNPVKSVYSWNRALNDSRRMFVSGDLAFYFGFASEIEEISRSNPNLNFDIAMLPQIRDNETPVTFGDMYGLSIMQNSNNFAGSIQVAAFLSTDPVLSILSEHTLLPPVTRTLLNQPPIAGIDSILYDSALISHAWLEPDSDGVDIVFRDLIEAISSGRLRISQAVSEAQIELTSLVK